MAFKIENYTENGYGRSLSIDAQTMLARCWNGSGKVLLHGTDFVTARALVKVGLGYIGTDTKTGDQWFCLSRIVEDVLLIGSESKAKARKDLTYLRGWIDEDGRLTAKKIEPKKEGA